MITPITMPKLGLTMDEGTILIWYKQPGEPVRSGEALLSVETDKVAIDVEAPSSGVLLKIVSPVGAVVPLGEVIAYIGEPGDTASDVEIAKDLLTPAETPQPSPAAGVRSVEAVPAATGEPVKVSPIARRLAEANDLDLAAIQGSGPGRRIVEADIQAALTARARPTSPGDIPYALQELTSTRKTTARRMLESWQSIPHFYLGLEIIAAPLVALRQALLPLYSSTYAIHLTYSDLILKALASTLPKHPLLNAAFYSESQVKLYSEINLGIAIAAGQGLVVGVIYQAGRLPLWEIARLRQSLSARAEERKLDPHDIMGGTFTLTNLGMYGIDDFSPIINPGQSAILAAGAILDRPANNNGQLVLRPTLRLTLAVDHRVADGAAGCLFLKDMRELLEAPQSLA
jgi:pyruvate dehydrogenase E2 component (dihydrolipoamide acetyltransferase)